VSVVALVAAFAGGIWFHAHRGGLGLGTPASNARFASAVALHREAARDASIAWRMAVAVDLAAWMLHEDAAGRAVPTHRVEAGRGAAGMPLQVFATGPDIPERARRAMETLNLDRLAPEAQDPRESGARPTAGPLATSWLRLGPDGAWVTVGPVRADICVATFALLPGSERLRVAVVPARAPAMPSAPPDARAWSPRRRGSPDAESAAAACGDAARSGEGRVFMHAALAPVGGGASAASRAVSEGRVR